MPYLRIASNVYIFRITKAIWMVIITLYSSSIEGCKLSSVLIQLTTKLISAAVQYLLSKLSEKKIRTLGCGYHIGCSVDKHKKYFSSIHVDLFYVLVDTKKKSATEDEKNNREKTKLINLISKQPEFC